MVRPAHHKSFRTGDPEGIGIRPQVFQDERSVRGSRHDAFLQVCTSRHQGDRHAVQRFFAFVPQSVSVVVPVSGAFNPAQRQRAAQRDFPVSAGLEAE